MDQNIMLQSDKFIIITTINQPTQAVFEFNKWQDWRVIVVGDRKTPADWSCDGVIYLGIEEQYTQFGELARVIPENTYIRKMLGYVYAIRCGATAIFESDDDNIPYESAERVVNELLESSNRSGFERRRSDRQWLNVYGLFGAPSCWPRGFPLEYLKDPGCEPQPGVDGHPWAVVQFLADEDPDVDAIYRMVDGSPCYFGRDRQYILDSGTYCPFNSQATLWTRETFPLLFLPLGVFDRVTDILRGYMATTALWKMGLSVSYASPVVYQKRNLHNLHKDFLQEIPLYANAASWCSQLLDIEASQPLEFYRTAIRLLEDQGLFLADNATAYDLFLRSAGLI